MMAWRAVTFGNPLGGALCLPLIAGMITLLFWHQLRAQRALSRLADVRHRDRLVTGATSIARRSWASVCTALGLVLILIAVARPQYSLGIDQDLSQDQSSHAVSHDCMIAVDISRSMLASDCAPSRLELVKAKMRALLRQLPSERVGLIIFSGTAMVQCPLTSDHATLLLFLDALDHTTVSSSTTVIAGALRTAIDHFVRSTKDDQHAVGSPSKVLLLCTDGEDFSPDLDTVTDLARSQHVKICVIGVGTPEGAPIPHYTPLGVHEGHLRDGSAQVVISRLNEPMLERLAQKLEGIYVRLEQDTATDLKKICAWLRQQQKQSYAVTARPMGELHTYCTAAGLLLLLIGWIV